MEVYWRLFLIFFKLGTFTLRPMVVALIGVSVYKIGKQAKINIKTVWIVLLVAALVSYFKFPPIIVIILGAVLGNIVMMFFKRGGDK